MRGSGTTFRRAVAVSVWLHVLLVAALVFVVRWSANRPDPAADLPILDTRATPDMRMDFAPDEVSVPVVAPSRDAASGDPAPPPLAASRHPQPDSIAGPPLARIPQTLPPELLALLKKPGPRMSDVVEVPITPTPSNLRPAPNPTPNPVQPASGTIPTAPPVPPVHGALYPGQTIVYVLDASGSMGEWGKFDRGRRALIATLRKQPDTVRFQVVVYAGTAVLPLPAPVGGCVAATEDHVQRMELALKTVAPAGRSNHLEGVRLAVSLKPDVVLILTDADDIPAAKVRGIVAQAGKPLTVCVAKVGADAVEVPREVK